MHQLIQELKLDARVHDCVDISNDSLCALYTSAEALLFPSLQEGFGWPIVEAQACGCPVITTHLPPMNVISGDAGIHIDPTNPEEAAKIIVKGLRKRHQIVAKGLSQSAEYSSDTMISEYLRIYETLSQ
jgi:Glycosyltransferase